MGFLSRKPKFSKRIRTLVGRLSFRKKKKAEEKAVAKETIEAKDIIAPEPPIAEESVKENERCKTPDQSEVPAAENVLESEQSKTADDKETPATEESTVAEEPTIEDASKNEPDATKEETTQSANTKLETVSLMDSVPSVEAEDAAKEKEVPAKVESETDKPETAKEKGVEKVKSTDTSAKRKTTSNSMIPKAFGRDSCFSMVFDLFSINESASLAEKEAKDAASVATSAKKISETASTDEASTAKSIGKAPSVASKASMKSATKDDASVASVAKSIGKTPSVASRASVKSATKDDASVASVAKSIKKTPSVASKASKKSATKDDASVTSVAKSIKKTPSVGSKASMKSATKGDASVASVAKSLNKTPSVASKVSTKSLDASVAGKTPSVASKASKAKSVAKDDASVKSAAKSIGKPPLVASKASASKASLAEEEVSVARSAARDEASVRSVAKSVAASAASAAQSKGKESAGAPSSKKSIMSAVKSIASRAGKSAAKSKGASKKGDESVASSKKDEPALTSIIVNDTNDHDSVASSIKESIYSRSNIGKTHTDDIRDEFAKLKSKATQIVLADEDGKELVARSFLDGDFADNPNLWKLPVSEISPLLPLSSLKNTEIHVGGNFFTKLRSEDIEGFVEETKKGGVAFCIEDRLWVTLSLTGLSDDEMAKLESLDPTQVFARLIKLGDKKNCKISYRVEDIQLFCACVPGLMSFVRLSPEQEEQRKSDLAAHEFLGEIVVKMREFGNTDGERELVDKASDILDAFLEMGLESGDDRFDSLLTRLMVAQEEGEKDLVEVALLDIEPMASLTLSA